MDMAFSLFLFQLAVLIFSVMVHEISHGLAAERLGDKTARLAGRLSMNPVRHIDPVGSLLVPFIFYITNSPVMLGWAKPVPFDPTRLKKDLKYGPLKVALAGPLSNVLVFFAFALLARVGIGVASDQLLALFGFIAFLNIFLAVFNLMPIPPLDGSHILSAILPPRYAQAFERIGFWGIGLVFVFVFLFSPIISAIAETLFNLVAGSDVVRMMGVFL